MIAKSGGPVWHWEFLDAPDMLRGPGAMLADLLQAVNVIAMLRGAARPPLAWQCSAPDGRALRAGQPRFGPRSRRPAVIVVPGWQARNGPHLEALVARDRAAARRLAAVHAAGGHVLTVFNGGALAGEAGLLEGRTVALHWAYAFSLLRHAPAALPAATPWAEDGRVWSAASPTLATELGLAVLQALGLGDLAESARAVVLPDASRQRLAALAAEEPASRVAPGALERARRHLEAHLHEPYSLAATARAAAVSERSLLRHFQRSFGQTPLQMLHALRVTRARMLLETSYLPVDAVAERCGWSDAAMLRKALRRATGLTPAAYRERYRLRADRRVWGRELPQP